MFNNTLHTQTMTNLFPTRNTALRNEVTRLTKMIEKRNAEREAIAEEAKLQEEIATLRKELVIQ